MKNKRNHNFYYKISSEINNENVEIYLGQSSGKQLLNEMLSAQKEVLVISPFVDSNKLEDLIRLRKQGVKVKIAFSKPYNKDHKEKILKQLIIQEKHTDESKVALKTNRLRKNKQWIIISLSFAFFSILFSLALMAYYYSFNFYFLASILFFTGVKYLIEKRKEIKKLPVFYYTYKERIKFKYFREYDNDRFIHSKIYILDRRVAYLGSMNFTEKGFTSNFETRVRITHQDQINNLVSFVSTIFNDSINFRGHEIDYLGRSVYNESLY